jgi:hypothetical protein
MLKKLAGRISIVLTAGIIIVMSTGIALAMQQGASKLPLRQYFSASENNAIWDWRGPSGKTPKQLSQLSEFLYLHQLKAVYVDLGAYASIMEQPLGAKRSADTKAFEAALTRYVAALQKRDIKVYASAGDVDWSKQTERHIPQELLAFAQDYNRQHPNTKLAGFEFDIEAYNQKGFAEASMTEKSLVLTEYLDMVELLTDKNATYVQSSKDQLELGFAIPYWFDNENGNIPAINWHNKTGPTLYHLMDTLNRLPHSNVVVMAYRNAASGNDGVISHSRTEIDYAHAKAPKVKVMIGQETANVEPAKITYYGRSATELSSQVRLVENEFKPSGVYGGVAINDLANYQKLDGAE